MERITRFRAILLILLFVLVLGAFSVRMYGMQMLGQGDVVDNASTYTTLIRVRAARGDILDCNGNLLVSNQASYNMVFNNYVILSCDDPNGNLLKLVELCVENGIEYEDHFPVTMERPYEYEQDKHDSTWQSYFQAFLSDLDIDSDVSANLLVRELRSRFKIPDDWTDEQARRVIGLRYELRLRSVTTLPSYEFIENVSSQDMTDILELNVPGLTAEVSTVRVYNTTYAAHILGTLGKIGPDDWPEYQEKGYEMDAYVGTSGLELAFEEYLHGTDGLLRRTVDKEGNIISEYYVTEPVAGNNVEVSIDLSLQAAAEDAMEQVFWELREVGVGEHAVGTDVEGGAVVAIDVKTGKILVCASYPTFDLSTYIEDFEELKEAEFQPLYNRALQASYAPGSTYKMVTTIAGIHSGIIDSETEIVDEGVYTKYDGFRPTCLVYSNYDVTHGSINVMDALCVSCNYFFYEVGDQLTTDALDSTAKAMGLGEPTGVELSEDTGRRANAETKASLYTGVSGQWLMGDKVLAAIGQSENRFTPLQLAVYASTLANKGTRYAATFMNRVVSSDYSTLVEEGLPEVLSTFEISDEAYLAYTEGMKRVVTEPMGTATSYFLDYTASTLCAKTGTAEHGSGGSSHGSFICFAPAEEPQIAIAVYGEKAGQGGNLGRIAKAILEAYFSGDAASDMVTNENRIG